MVLRMIMVMAFALFCGLAVPLPHAQAEDPVPLALMMQQRYAQVRSFTASFVQRLEHRETGMEETRTGKLIFSRPLNIVWATEAPCEERLIVAKDSVWDYLPEEKTAYKYAPEVVNDSRSVIRIITGQNRLDRDFTVVSESDENGLAVVRIYPKEPSTQMIEGILWIDKKSFFLNKVQIIDFYGNINEIRFTSIVPDASIHPSIFAFIPPKGTRIEDLTNNAAPERPLLQ